MLIGFMLFYVDVSLLVLNEVSSLFFFFLMGVNIDKYFICVFIGEGEIVNVCVLWYGCMSDFLFDDNMGIF